VLPGSPFARVQLRVGSWSTDQLAAVREEGETLELAMGELLRAGAAVDSDEVQRTIAAWAIHLGRFCTLTPELLAGLGQHYVAHPAFRARYEAIEPGLAFFLRDAIAFHCHEMEARNAPANTAAAAPDVGRSLP